MPVHSLSRSRRVPMSAMESGSSVVAVENVDDLVEIVVHCHKYCQFSEETVWDKLQKKHLPIGQKCGQPTRKKANGMFSSYCIEHERTLQARSKLRSAARAEAAMENDRRERVFLAVMKTALNAAREALESNTDAHLEQPDQPDSKGRMKRVALCFNGDIMAKVGYRLSRSPKWTQVGQKFQPVNSLAKLGMPLWDKDYGRRILFLKDMQDVFGETMRLQALTGGIFRKTINDIVDNHQEKYDLVVDGPNDNGFFKDCFSLICL